jgi:glycosyltransferase involved in cell wall biosynthesis
MTDIIRSKNLIENPTVSIILSVYNASPFLDKALQSLIDQTYKQFEIIVINDGSSDNSESIIRKFLEEDDRIVLVNQENIGLTKSLNKGIQLARGKYIARQDADDISLKGRLEKQVSLLNNSDYDIIGTSVILIDEEGNELQTKVFENCDDLYQKILKANQFVHGSIMFRNIGIRYREKFYFAQDYDFYLHHGQKYKLGFESEVLYKIRISSSSISTIKKDEQTRYGVIGYLLAVAKDSQILYDSWNGKYDYDFSDHPTLKKRFYHRLGWVRLRQKNLVGGIKSLLGRA